MSFQPQAACLAGIYVTPAKCHQQFFGITSSPHLSRFIDNQPSHKSRTKAIKIIGYNYFTFI
nr:MAG TPA: hypothetical protein [Caudoviricetes sp.]